MSILLDGHASRRIYPASQAGMPEEPHWYWVALGHCLLADTNKNGRP